MVLAVGEDDDRPPFGVLLVVEGAGRRLQSPTEVSPAGLDQWMEIFRVVQGAEIWANHGPWLERTKPDPRAFLAWLITEAGERRG